MAKSRIAEAYVQVIPTTDGFSKDIQKEIEKGYSDANETVQKEAVEQSEETGKKSGKALAAGLASSGMAVALGKIFNEAIQTAIDQQSQDIKLEAKFNLSDVETEAAKAAIDNLYTGAYGENREEIANTMGSIISTVKGAREASAEELEKMGKDFLNLSSVFEDVDPAAIAKSVDVMISTGMAKDYDEAISTVTAGLQTMGEHGDDWLDSLNEYSDDFVKFGLTGADAVNFVNSALDAGAMNTDKVADALNEMSITITDGSIDDVIKAMGMDPDDLRARIAEGGESAKGALMEVMTNLQQNGGTEDFQKFMSSMGEDFQDVFKNMDLSKVNGQLAEGAGNLEKMDEALSGTMQSNITELQRVFEQAFVDTVAPVLEALTPILVELAGWISENTEVVAVLAGVLGLLFVATIVAATVALWGMAAAGWAAMAPFLPIIGLILLIVIAIAAVIAAVWAVWANWDKVWAAIKNIAGGVGEWFVDLWNGITGWFVDLWNGIGDFFVGLWDGITGWFVDAWTGVKDFFVGLWDGLKNFFVGIYEYIMNLIETMIDKITDVKNAGKDAANEIANTGGTPLSGVARLFGFGDKEKRSNGKNAFGGVNIPLMAEGGTVPARDGGTLAILGEAGRSEVVMDAGKWNTMLDKINSGQIGGEGKAGNNIVFNITQKENESAEDIVNKISEYLDFTGLRG